LLPEDQHERLEVVLVSPRNPLNIGAAARAMANFGFRRLTVVAPFAPHWREARSAVGAPELLKDARETATLAEAVAGCTLVLGTGSLTYRKAEQAVVQLPQLAAPVRQELGRGGRVAVVFGPEKHGLTREDLSYCHVLVEIPTDVRQPSMNLGQAVAVCLYELAARAFAAEEGPSGAKAQGDSAGSMFGLKPGPTARRSLFPADEACEEDAAGSMRELKPMAASRGGSSAAPSGELELLAGLVEETMAAAGYSPRLMQAANRHDLRLLLRRLAPAARDTRRMMGLFRRILWRLQHARTTGEQGGGRE
jgi:tRNA/rRNA methyltransferase